jgi:hypothetical protein
MPPRALNVPEPDKAPPGTGSLWMSVDADSTSSSDFLRYQQDANLESQDVGKPRRAEFRGACQRN